MKAIVCTKYGPPEVLQLQEVEKPTPKDGEVLVKIYATTVTVADSRVRGFRVPPSFWLPARLTLGLSKPKLAILGTDFAGEIVQTGKGVRSFKTGDHVFGNSGHTRFGANAEYVSLPENSAIVLKPKNVTYEEAAAIPFGGMTALYFLKKSKDPNRTKSTDLRRIRSRGHSCGPACQILRGRSHRSLQHGEYGAGQISGS